MFFLIFIKPLNPFYLMNPVISGVPVRSLLRFTVVLVATGAVLTRNDSFPALDIYRRDYRVVLCQEKLKKWKAVDKSVERCGKAPQKRPCFPCLDHRIMGIRCSCCYIG